MAPPPPPPPPWKGKATCTPASRAISRKKTSSDNRPSSAPADPTTSSSATSPPASTSSVQGSRGYWSSSAAGLSRRLWLPTEIGYVDSHSTLSSVPVHSNQQPSWFSTRTTPPTSRSSLTTFWPSTPSSRAECKEDEPQSTEGSGKKRKRGRVVQQMVEKKQKKPEHKELIRAIQIKLYPNAEQKHILRRWMGIGRLVYNTVVAWSKRRRVYYKTQPIQPAHRTWLKFPTTAEKKRVIGIPSIGQQEFLRRLKDVAMLKKGIRLGGVDCPWNVADESMQAAIVARDALIQRNMQRQQGQPVHNLSFRRKKDNRDTITIRASNFSKSPWHKFFVRTLHNNVVYNNARSTTEPIKMLVEPLLQRRRPLNPLHFEKRRTNNGWPREHKITKDSKLTYDALCDTWTLSWVYGIQKSAPACETQAGNVVALDPGVRTFMTFYSPTEGAGKIGCGDMKRLVKLADFCDQLQSRRSKMLQKQSSRRRNKAHRLSVAMARIRRKITALCDEVHRKTTNYLVRTYKTIVIPAFNVSQMVGRRSRTLRKSTVRQMLGWSHYQFRQRLLSKAEEKDVNVVIQDEAYTTKTCSNCGHMQRVNKIFSCRGCHIFIDRDFNGARGILLRALLDGAVMFLGADDFS